MMQWNVSRWTKLVLLLVVFVGLPSCGGGGSDGGRNSGDREATVLPPNDGFCRFIYESYDELVDLGSPEGRATALAGCRLSYCDTGTSRCSCCEMLFGGPTVEPPPTTDDHGNARSSATSLALGGSRSGRIERADDVDFFRITLTASGSLTVYTTGSLDTIGALQDDGGQPIATSDDGTDLNFNIEHDRATPGTYFVRVSAYASGRGDYTVFARFRDDAVQPPPTNRRPQVRRNFDDLSDRYNRNEPWIYRWQSEDLDTYFVDPDGDHLHYTVSSDDSHIPVAINPFSSSGRVVWILAHGDGSEGLVLARITVTASDSSGESISRTFSVTLFSVVTEAPPPPSSRRYGAIAFSFEENCSGYVVGVASGYDSRNEAETNAVERCRVRSGTDCTASGGLFGSAFGSDDQCGALAYGTTARGCAYRVRRGMTRRDAQTNALQACRNDGYSCSIPRLDNGQLASSCAQ